MTMDVSKRMAAYQARPATPATIAASAARYLGDAGILRGDPGFVAREADRHRELPAATVTGAIYIAAGVIQWIGGQPRLFCGDEDRGAEAAEAAEAAELLIDRLADALKVRHSDRHFYFLDDWAREADDQAVFRLLGGRAVRAGDLKVGDRIPTRKPNPIGPVSVERVEHDPATPDFPVAFVYVDILCAPDADPSGFSLAQACGAQEAEYLYRSGQGLRAPHRYRLRYDPKDVIASEGDTPTDTYTHKRMIRKGKS